MYCAGCGQTVTNQGACPQCGRPIDRPGPATVSEAAELYVFERTVRRLRQYWFLFACLNVALGVAGLVMVQFGVLRLARPWEPWAHPPLLEWMTPKLTQAALHPAPVKPGHGTTSPVKDHTRARVRHGGAVAGAPASSP